MTARPSRRRVLLAAAAIPAALALPAPATAKPRSDVDTALEWYDHTVDTIANGGASAQVTNSRTWAVTWIAATRAVKTSRDADHQTAAFAQAAHDALAALAPSRVTQLDAALAATLARVPDGTAKTRGIAAGREKAAAALAEREGDGLDPASVSPPYEVPAAAPAVWRPTPPAYGPPQQAGTRNARPFLLGRADRFRPGPPPEIGSAQYVEAFREVRAYGDALSTVRTREQLDTALFWYGSSLVLYNGILRAAVRQAAGRPLAFRAALVAQFHVSSVDTQIATSDTKYAYLWWRPVTAIRWDTDPEWTPVHVTPSHPDYPSGHNTYSGSAERILTALTGPSPAAYTISSPSAPGVTRTYTSWRRPSLENADARVWSGIHTRYADETGLWLGRRVAAHTLRSSHLLF